MRRILAATLLLLLVASPVAAQEDVRLCLEVTYSGDRLVMSDILDEGRLARALRRGTVVVDRASRCGETASAPRPTPRPQAMTSWSDDPSLTYRWLDPSEFDCEYGDRCWGMLVHTTAGCPGNLYVELQLLADDDRTVVGFTNETSGALLAGQDARLIFEVFEEEATGARPTEMNCY